MMVATHTQALVYRLAKLMPSADMRSSLQGSLALFFASSRPRAQPSQTEISRRPQSLSQSRWLAHRKGHPSYPPSLKRLIASYLKSHRGRLPIVYAVVDLTCLAKTGKDKELQGLVRTYNGKRGCTWALLSLAIGPFRSPWRVRVYRGKGTATPTQLALKLLSQIPQPWRERFQIRVLAGAGFSTTR